MKLSQYFLPTLKESPADAEIISHKLMLRASMIRKVAAGIYTWLPLGLRVLQKVEQIIREEMNRAGALEIFMPNIQPAELWQETQRWEAYGPLMLRMKDRHEREFCFGPTHEEVITDLVRGELRSYKQLPLTLYQIQTKFRDEIRPRFGILRGREFMMKDAYSFNIDKKSLEETYEKMYQAYSKIFDRLGLTYRAVLADSGDIGGDMSHEFQVLAKSGEDVIAYSDESNYAANIEKAEALAPKNKRAKPTAAMEVIDTPGCYTIKALCDKFNIDVKKTVKTLMVKGIDHPIVALILRGDHELNEIKAANLEEVEKPLKFIDEKEVKATLGAGFGSLGPVDLSLPTIVDRDAAVVSDFSCGANVDDKHYVNVNWDRDVTLPKIADLRNVAEGDPSPDGKGKLVFARGIEVGHIFQNGDKYTKPMQLTVLSESGKAIFPLTGCYGIGVSRIVGAAIEQNYDKKGICWPEAMAPFQVLIIPMNMHKSYRVKEAAEKIYQELEDANIEVLFDDRKERPGVMFADAELIGIPHQIIIGERGLDKNIVEYKSRRGEEKELSIASLVSEVQALLAT